MKLEKYKESSIIYKDENSNYFLIKEDIGECQECYFNLKPECFLNYGWLDEKCYKENIVYIKISEIEKLILCDEPQD